MFKTLIILYALNFWVIECTPNPGRSFQHWLASMTQRCPRSLPVWGQRRCFTPAFWGRWPKWRCTDHQGLNFLWLQ